MKDKLPADYLLEAAMSYDLRHGDLSQPKTTHDMPADYGLTTDDVKKSRLRFLRQELSRAEAEAAFRVGDLFNHYCSYTEAELVAVQRTVAKIKNQISFTLHSKPGQKQRSYDIARIKQIPMDTITQINNNRFFQVNPFREENSPSNSLYWYPAENRCTDFGSGKSYDTIDLYSAINKMDIKTAMRELSACV